jgi:hypothetical protein
VSELRLVETGWRASKIIDAKVCRHRVELQPAVLIGGVPETKQVIHDRLWQKPALAELVHADTPVAFREWRAVGAGDQRDVTVMRHAQLERLEQQDLARRVGQMIFAAQHVRHAHQRVVDSVAEKELRASVSAPHDEVTDIVAGKLLRTAHEVAELYTPASRHAESQGRRQSTPTPLVALSFGQVAAGPRVSWRSPRGELRAARDVELEWRTKAGIGQALGLQSREMTGIDRTALRLPVGRQLRRGSRLVPGETEPAQIRDLPLEELLAAPFEIGVFDPQQEAPWRRRAIR